MNGWRMIRVSSGNSVYACERGTVEYSPKLKYRIEKKNAFDPAYIHRREPYREDEFTLEAPLLPEFYASLLYFLTQPGSFYLEFDHAGARKQFPVTIDSLPRCADDLHEYRDAVKFTLESRYTGTPTAINFDIIIPQEDDDTTITTG